MTEDQTLEDLKNTLSVIVPDSERVAAMQSSIARLETKLKTLLANDDKLNVILSKKADEVAKAQAVIDEADATAKKLITDGQTEANTIINKAMADAAEVAKAAGKESDDVVAAARDHALFFEPLITELKAELAALLESVKATKTYPNSAKEQ